MSLEKILNSFRFSTIAGVGCRVYDESVDRFVYYSNKSLNNSGYLMYGPYANLPKVFYKVEYKLKALNVPGENEKVAIVDISSQCITPNIYTSMPARVEGSKDIYEHDLLEDNYSSVILPLNVDSDNSLYEFRVCKCCACDLSAFIEITPLTEKEFHEI